MAANKVWSFTTEKQSASIATVTSLYQNILGRDPDPVGLAGWSNALRSGLSRTQVAQALFNSREYHEIFVRNLYSTVLQRGVDPVGLSWATAMDRGLTETNITASIYGSFEYCFVE